MSAATIYKNEVEAYRKFRDDRLIPEHKRFLKQIENLESEIRDYKRLMNTSYKGFFPNINDNNFYSNSIKTLPIKIPLDLGSGYSVDFEIFDHDQILISVGFGFYCQMTWPETVDFCAKRIEMLARRRIKFGLKLEKMEEHLKVTEEIISHLSNEKE